MSYFKIDHKCKLCGRGMVYIKEDHPQRAPTYKTDQFLFSCSAFSESKKCFYHLLMENKDTVVSEFMETGGIKLVYFPDSKSAKVMKRRYLPGFDVMGWVHILLFELDELSPELAVSYFSKLENWEVFQ